MSPIKQRGAPLIANGRCSDGRRAVTIDEFAALLGVSRSTAYAVTSGGEVPVVCVGGRRLVAVAVVEALLAGVSGSVSGSVSNGSA